MKEGSDRQLKPSNDQVHQTQITFATHQLNGNVPVQRLYAAIATSQLIAS
ncbi:MAG: hypothetical protein KME11_03545 [Timaviella obliquedivisa GSE-PSE-MK23-08B]|nr:hypothetical protein [Timaviella obliquedivisa GSE-PSE-MK23-08B]